ncbi:MAG: hypothetical protein Q8N07_03970 [Rhodocyclaceae bacterium]|nr:hypothetical protein [Rhodocyclaceae bacterium]
MAQAIVGYATNPEQARVACQTGRVEIEQRFSMEAMVEAYRNLYDGLTGSSNRPQ